MVINLNADERIALQKVAMKEKRKSRDQAEWITRQELERRGLLPTDTTQPITAAKPSEAQHEAQPA